MSFPCIYKSKTQILKVKFLQLHDFTFDKHPKEIGEVEKVHTYN